MNVPRAVDDQMKTVTEVSQGNGGNGFMIECEREEAFWKDVGEFPWAGEDTPYAVLKAGLLISEVPRIFLALERLTDKFGIRARASARAGNGVVIISAAGDNEPVLGAVKELREFSESAGGSLILVEAPPSVKSGIDAWGGIGSSLNLMKRIKSGFDPGNILNPGRLF
jgi:glycolate oxidase FAD binding subunit